MTKSVYFSLFLFSLCLLYLPANTYAEDNYSIGGITNNHNNPITLLLNSTEGSTWLHMSEPGEFVFNMRLPAGAAYDIDVLSDMNGDNGRYFVTNGNGIVSQDIDDIVVSRKTERGLYFVGGNVSGLSGTLMLQNNAETLVVFQNGSFSFNRPFSSGDSYNITITAQPENKFCTVFGGSGVVGNDVTNVEVVCEDHVYPIPQSSHGYFYAVGSPGTDGSSDIYRFTYTEGEIKNFEKLSEAGRNLADIAFDEYSGMLYAIETDTGFLYAIDFLDGSISYVGASFLYQFDSLDTCYNQYGVLELLAWGGQTLVSLNRYDGSVIEVKIDTLGRQSSGDLLCSAPSVDGDVLYGIGLGGDNDELVLFDNSWSSESHWMTLNHTEVWGGDIDARNNMFVARSHAGKIYLYYINPYTKQQIFLDDYITAAGLHGLTIPIAR